jgi:predicted DNA-binding protein
MTNSKRLNITLHPEDIEMLDKLCITHSETRSGMIRRLITYRYIEEVSRK